MRAFYHRDIAIPLRLLRIVLARGLLRTWSDKIAKICGKRVVDSVMGSATVTAAAAAAAAVAAAAGGGGATPPPTRLMWMKGLANGRRGEMAAAAAAMEDEEPRRKPRLVIIGAGMAGISAAHRLRREPGATGKYELTVLEASDRIGGRICSTEFNGEGIELGATWIHGIEKSPVYEKAVQIGAIQSAERAWEGKDGFIQMNNAVVRAEGGVEVAPELVEPVVDFYRQMLQVAEDVKGGGGGRPAADLLSGCISVGDFLHRGLERFLAEQKSDEDEDEDEREMPNNRLFSEIPAASVAGRYENHPRWTKRSLQEGCFKLHENMERNITAADDLSDMDLLDYDEYLEFGGEHKTIGKGYSSVVGALASCLPPGTIQFGQKVEKVVWGNSNPYGGAPVSIYCRGGAVLQADHVIITVSLGVLKARTVGAHKYPAISSKMSAVAAEEVVDRQANLIAKQQQCKCGGGDEEANTAAADEDAPLFYPELPKWKLDSISKLGFGVVDKVFVEAEPAEDGGNHRAIQFVFDPRAEGGREHSQQQKEETVPSGVPSWIRKSFSLYPIHEKSHNLVMWFAGQEATKVESLPDDQILGGISRTLTSFGIPEHQQGTFKSIRRSRWGQNPLFRGSYSYVRVGSTGHDIDSLAAPVPDVDSAGGAAQLQLLFAGEATHRNYYSTTHGAYLSGVREAERLLHFYGFPGHANGQC